MLDAFSRRLTDKASSADPRNSTSGYDGRRTT